jgi:hypothetical protein
VPDAEGLDPPLLPEGERDEEAQLDELRNREEPVELLPQRLVGDVGIPDDRARVGQRRLLARAELLGVRERQQLVVLLFGQAFPSALDGALDASVVARDRFRDVDPTELLHGVVEGTVPERQIPRLREGADDGGIVRADRLALGTGRALTARQVEIAEDLGICDGCRINVGNVRHRPLLSPRRAVSSVPIIPRWLAAPLLRHQGLRGCAEGRSPMADDRIRRNQDDIDLDDEETLPAEGGGLAELSEGETDEDDDLFDDDDD